MLSIEEVNELSSDDIKWRMREVETNLHKLTPTMESIGAIYLENKVPMKITVGNDGSYTNNTFIKVSISPYEAVRMNDDEINKTVRFKVGHECQHIKSTDDNEYSRAICNIKNSWNEEAKKRNIVLSSKKIEQYSNFLVNAIEDGRIENIMCLDFPGITKYRNWYRLLEWQEYEVSPEINEAEALLNEIHAIACRGIHSKGFNNVFKNTRVEKLVNDCIKKISDAVTSNCKKCMDKCEEIADIIQEVLFDYMQGNDEAENEQFKKTLEDMNMSNFGNFSNSDNEDEDRRLIVAILTDDNEGEENGSENVKPDIVIDLRKNPSKDEESSEDESSKGEGSSKGEESSEDESSKGEGSSKGEESSEDESSKGEGSSKGKENSEDESSKGEGSSKGEESSGDESSKGEGSAKSEESSGESKSNDNSNNGISELTPEQAANTLSEAKTLTASEIEALIASQIQELEERMTEESRSLREILKTDTTKKEKIDIEKLDSVYGGRGFEDIKIQENIPNKVKAPTSIINKGTVLRGNMENIIASLATNDREEVYDGDLDVNSLSRFCIGELNVFSSEGEPYEPNMCGYILKDNSGSMSGSKEENCCEALAVIEEAFKTLIPLKITAFEDQSSVIHKTIKDWEDDDSSINYVWSYHSRYGTGGSNNDAYSIAVATEELLQRPEEKKLLIVLSDGMPCCSPVSVTKAVKDARDKGIFVIAIFFGTDSFLERYDSNYKLLYEKYYIGVSPDRISNELVRLLEIFIEQ